MSVMNNFALDLNFLFFGLLLFLNAKAVGMTLVVSLESSKRPSLCQKGPPDLALLKLKQHDKT